MTTGIHDLAIVADGAKIGRDVEIGPFSIVGADVELGDGVILHNGVTVSGRTKIGSGTEIYPGAVIGVAPQILGYQGNENCRVEIGARNIIREHVTIHAGSPELKERTFVGDDCLLMVGVHIAHDCYVADKCVFANQVTLGGNVHVEEQVWVGGMAAIKQHSRVGKHSFAAGGSMIRRSVIPYGFVLGNFANLAGLNLVGLKRRGFERKTIHDLRAAYRMLFAKEGKFAERIADTKEAYGHREEVRDILNFIESYETLEITLPE